MVGEMEHAATSERRTTKHSATSWRVRLALVLLSLVAVLTVYFTNRLLTDRFTETTRNRAELRLALYSGNLPVSYTHLTLPTKA